MLAIEEEARLLGALEAARVGKASRLAGAAERAEAEQERRWLRQLPGHLRVGAELGLPHDQQKSLRQRDERARAEAAAAAAAIRREKESFMRGSASVPAMLTAMRHRSPPAMPRYRPHRHL